MPSKFGVPVLSDPKKEFQNYVALFTLMIGAVMSVPVLNNFVHIVPVPNGVEWLFNMLGFLVSAFVLALVYVMRTVIWDWHTGALPFRMQLRALDRKIYRLSQDIQTNSAELDALKTRYRNLLRFLRVTDNAGGGMRIPVLASVLFVLGCLSIVDYSLTFLSFVAFGCLNIACYNRFPLSSMIVPLLETYSISFAFFTGTFACFAISVLESSSYRKEFRVIR